MKGSKQERKLLDYQSHMALIAPHIANGLVLLITFKQISKLNNQSNINVTNGDFRLLPMLHHVTSGLKSLSSEQQYIAVDELR
jgi:hypothetical protein